MIELGATTPITAIAFAVCIPDEHQAVLHDAIRRAQGFSTATAKDMAAQMQTRAKAAFEKGGEMTSQVTDFHKANIEALVESGKILASGMQDMGRSYAEEAKSAAETVQEDMKKFTAIKSPTELFELQGEIARRNFDAMVSTASKNTEAMLKLVNEAFAPVPLAWAQAVGADKEKLNVNGGAMALGHPLGGTGCKLMTTLLHELERRGDKLGIQVRILYSRLLC